MSIEVDINRIATALEELVKIGRGGVSVPTANQLPPAPPKVPVGRPAANKTISMGKVTTVQAPAPAPSVDPITGDPVGTVEPVSQDQVHAALQTYMEKNGVDGANGVKALMIKHGANKVKPTITSIPPENYAALITEASS